MEETMIYNGHSVSRCKCGEFPNNIGKQVSCACGRKTAEQSCGDYNQEVWYAISKWNIGKLIKE